MGMEYKSFDFEMKSFRKDNDFAYFEGYLSTFGNIDRDDDVIAKGAFTESIKELTPSLFWVHKSSEPLGIFESLVEDDVGLYVKAKMPLADEFVKNRVVPQMEIGSLKFMSAGFSIPDYNKNVEYKDGIRYILKVKLWEGSLVPIPANPLAAIKSHDRLKVEDLKGLDERSLEKAFHEGSSFSKKDSKMLVSFVKKGLIGDDQNEQRDAGKDSENDSADWSEVISSIKQIKQNIEEK